MLTSFLRLCHQCYVLKPTKLFNWLHRIDVTAMQLTEEWIQDLERGGECWQWISEVGVRQPSETVAVFTFQRCKNDSKCQNQTIQGLNWDNYGSRSLSQRSVGVAPSKFLTIQLAGCMVFINASCNQSATIVSYVIFQYYLQLSIVCVNDLIDYKLKS